MAGYLSGLSQLSDAAKGGAAPKLGAGEVTGSLGQAPAADSSTDPLTQLVAMRSLAQQTPSNSLAGAGLGSPTVAGGGPAGYNPDAGLTGKQRSLGMNDATQPVVGGTVQQVLQNLAAQRGWTGGQWDALNNMEMREAGYNLTAQNPTSSAYGLAQFIQGPSEYAQYGGDSTTAAGEGTAMLNYIQQRYGDPQSAWAHEQQFGWY